MPIIPEGTDTCKTTALNKTGILGENQPAPASDGGREDEVVNLYA